MVSIIVDPEKGIGITDLEGYEQINKAINATGFDVVRMFFPEDKDRVLYDVYVDEIGLYKDLTVSIIPVNYPAIVGPVVFSRSNAAGESVSLTAEDCIKIFTHIQYYHPDKEDHTKVFCIMTGVCV